jgi:hypothetical protein
MMPFIDYLNRVDRILERGGQTTTEEDLELVASCQEQAITPARCAGYLERRNNEVLGRLPKQMGVR